MKNDALNKEWCLLQNQFDSYEKHSLFIKLASILLLAGALLADMASYALGFVLAILWLQDAIWKTFQSRIETRLLAVELNIKTKNTDDAFQYNSRYQESACSGGALIKEYLTQAIRPTVAFPHLVLIGLLIFLVLK